ncbi:hypothetical protein CN533_27290 [Priestia megaterium]|uniref:hypothetical protein n=1 Tax=Priestia megaterium TaxID=1404 RepID=UPI000BFA0055|nr:hypothetical protein [Priestia megaterium]PET68296.1 hypothetical protein CN533_27290 [Priestia megaterium]PFK82649.1 hypothetical protein COJ19_25835 [Priestia megaterium]
MKSQLYFWKPMMNYYQEELNRVELYYNKSKSVFEFTESDIENEVAAIINSIEMPEGSIDPSDLGDYMEDMEVSLYETALAMKSNHLFITISMLGHMWEQQVVRFVRKELRESFGQRIGVISFSKALEVIEKHGVEYKEQASFTKIKELRLLVNTIKHAEGQSAERLRRIRPDFFETEGFSEDDIMDILELNDSVLLDPYSLNVKETDLFDYIKATQDFWNEMPERAFYDWQADSAEVVN